jgi:hypothetical protein
VRECRCRDGALLFGLTGTQKHDPKACQELYTKYSRQSGAY